ncbi:MAG: S1/P1 Nuclease [Bacteroidia bacterium]|nr:S1/P1 Nuclease [Bacteroidia bacterium]
MLLLVFSNLAQNAYSWGFWAHRRVNYMACFTLPPELFGFYKKHIDYITEHAVDPDKRRHSDKAEAPRHYIDIDHYGEDAIDSLPRFWKDAVAKLTEDTLNSYGIVPWYIPKVYYNLQQAFKEKNEKKILYYSANLGHYIGDACVPLHCTKNYNGQLTNQHGIHGFWESRLPELFGENYDYLTGAAKYIPRVQEYCWQIVRESSQALDSVLRFERELNDVFPSDLKYAFESRGAVTMKVYSREYSDAFHKLLDGQVERRMRAAIIAIGSFWYTAWVNAGSPDLNAPMIDKAEFITEDAASADSIKGKVRDCD